MAETRAQDLLHQAHNTQQVGAETSALNELGVLMYIQARYPEALELMQQSVALLPPDSREKLARGTNNIGLILVAMGKFDEALLYFERSIEHYRAAHNRIGQGTYFNNIGLIHYQLGQYDEALKNFEASLALRQSTGDRPGAATSLHNLGLVYMVTEQPDRAAEYFRESLEMTSDLHLPVLIARLLLNIGSIERHRGNTTLATDYYRRSLLTARQDKNPEGTAVALLNLGALLRELGNYDESSLLLAEALELSRSIGQKEYEASSLGELALIRRATTTPANPQQHRALLNQNVADLRTGVELLQEIHSMETDKWKKELAAAEQELAILEAGSL
jgi:tetratricopeptide (TPR) repeat protein